MIAVLGNLVAWAFSGLLGRVLVGGGLTLVLYTGVSATLEFLLDELVAALNGLPADSLQIALLFGLGDSLSLIASALVTRATLMAAGQVMGLRKSPT